MIKEFLSYPSFEEIQNANRIQLARWYRFLPSPGISGNNLSTELMLMEKIMECFKQKGGMTPEISKHIGWEI